MELGPRGTAWTILGLASLVAADPSADCSPRRTSACWPPSWSSATSRRPTTTGAGSSRRSPTTTPSCRYALFEAVLRHGRAGEPARGARVPRVPRRHLLREWVPERSSETAGWHVRGGEKPAGGRAGDRRRGLRARVPRRLSRHGRSPLPPSHARVVRVVPRRQPTRHPSLRPGDGGLSRRAHGHPGQSEPRCREHHLLPDVAPGDARALRGRASSTPVDLAEIRA